MQINYFSDTNKNKPEKERKKVLREGSAFLVLKSFFHPLLIISSKLYPRHRFSMTRQEGVTSGIQ